MKSSRFIQNLESSVTDSLSLLETASPCGEVSLTPFLVVPRPNSAVPPFACNVGWLG
jgi:hypothetical protein